MRDICIPERRRDARRMRASIKRPSEIHPRKVVVDSIARRDRRIFAAYVIGLVLAVVWAWVVSDAWVVSL